MKHYVKCEQSKSEYRAHKRADREWRTKYAERQKLWDDQSKAWNDAYANWAAVMRGQISEQFQEYLDRLNTVDITVELGLDLQAEITFEYKSGYGPKWSYRIKLNRKGAVISRSNCWFHLDEIGPDRAEDMLYSAQFLKVLISFDWQPLLERATKAAPVMSDYITVKPPEIDEDYADPGYAQELAQQEAHALVGTDYWVKVRVLDRWVRWIKILSEDSDSYTVQQIDIDHGAGWGLEPTAPPLRITRNPYSFTKDHVYYFYPLEILSEAEILPQVEDGTLDLKDTEK